LVISLRCHWSLGTSFSRIDVIITITRINGSEICL